MAKAPLPGTVKTRLHPLLDPRGCASLQEALIRHTLGLVADLGADTFLAFHPAGEYPRMRRLVPGRVSLLPQRGNHLGQRLTAASTDVLARSPGPLVVLGTDTPTLTADGLTGAFAGLTGGADVVLGPAVDGGYYLIGMRQPDAALFDIDPALWGGASVLAATLAQAARRGLDVQLLPPLRDLDTPGDACALLDDPLLPAPVAALLRRVADR
ncbi:MAG TPA: TIGR04282 family arsenosugar biosynthesis glycosyltransferase [Mycobacteriales bacterium]|nr:TIGR04282 family arsenosugar biosynthesis glycosyltransferase [Mycobacteriales bacterium]